MHEEVSCQKNFFLLNNLVFLILVFFIDQHGVSDKHCLLSFFSLPVVIKPYECYSISLLTGSSIGSEFAWHTSGPEFDPHVRHILSWRLGHENISTAILPLPLIQEEELSVTGERMCTKYW